MRYPVNPARPLRYPGSGLDARASTAPQGSVLAYAGTAGSSKPVLLVIDDEAKALRRIGRELRKRYGSDYRIVCGDSAEAGITKLRELAEVGEEVVLVLADQWMPGMTGVEFLGHVREVYPTARRALLTERSDRTAPEPILR